MKDIFVKADLVGPGLTQGSRTARIKCVEGHVIYVESKDIHNKLVPARLLGMGTYHAHVEFLSKDLLVHDWVDRERIVESVGAV